MQDLPAVAAVPMLSIAWSRDTFAAAGGEAGEDRPVTDMEET